MLPKVEINQRFKNQLKYRVVEEFEKSAKPRWNLAFWWPVVAPVAILVAVVGWSQWHNQTRKVTLPGVQSEAVSLQNQLVEDEVILAAIEFREL